MIAVNTHIMLLLPLVGMLLVMLMGQQSKTARSIAFAFSLISAAQAIYACILFVPGNIFQFGFSFPWIENLDINFSMAVDGISLVLILLTNILVPLIILSSFNREIKNPRTFYALILLMQFALIGVFGSTDAFLFYIFWELALIPIWFICLLWGGKDAPRITLKFFIYTLTGSLFMLVGIIYMYLLTPGTHSFSWEAFKALELTDTQSTFVFWMMFLAFAIKMPVFPLHTWQPDTYTDAPTQGTMLLSGIMLKMGVYGVIRWMIPLVPEAFANWGMVAVVLSVVGIIYASCIAIVQSDYKRLIAYSSIAHVGLIAAGVFTMNEQCIHGAMIQMFAHGVNVVGLFLIADILFNRFGTRTLNQLGGVAHAGSTFTILFVIIMLGSVALPLTNGFVGEFLLLTGLYQYNAMLALLAGLSVILGAVYMLRSYQAIMLGEARSINQQFTSLALEEKTVLAIVAMIIIITGVYTSWITNMITPSINQLFN